MKQYLTILLTLLSLGAMAQGVDSTRIPQAFDLEQKYVLHIFKGADQNDPDIFNMTNVFLPQMDTVGKDTSAKMIYFPAWPSGCAAREMRRLANLPEGQATTYNNDILERILPKITNPWLFNQMIQIRDDNWRIRDRRIREEYELMIKRKAAQ